MEVLELLLDGQEAASPLSQQEAQQDASPLLEVLELQQLMPMDLVLLLILLLPHHVQATLQLQIKLAVC